MNDFQANPKAMSALSSGFSELGGSMSEITGGGADRLAFLSEAAGNDEMGEEIRQNLLGPARQIEEAFGKIQEVVSNQAAVTNGMATRLQNMENAINTDIGRPHRGGGGGGGGRH
ncbi:hypothetical protein ABTX61_09100 [Amycolatopsis japonica]|uniref:hypothetical protein n=1 Tax=Amycolatopsis japonica TaxID=208439 RepID=UPI0033175622